MTRARLMRFVAALFATVAALALAAPTGTHAADKSFSLPSLDTTAVVTADGSMQVTEVITYDFSGGPFNFGIRSFTQGDDRDRIVDFTAADELGSLTVIPPAQSVSGEWEWQLRSPTSDRRVTYALTYRVPGAVTVHADVADLYWQFIGNDHPGVGQMRVHVQLPPGIPAATDGVADDDTSVLRAFAHGPSNGVITVGDSTADATVSGVPGGQFVELRVIAPASAFASATAGSDTALASILAEERAYQAEVRDLADRHRLGWILTPVLGGLGLVGTGVLWFVGGREKRSTEVLGDYWREPLDELPAVALANLHRGTIEPNATIAGTLVDLAQRGYLRIVGRREERFGPDKTVHEFHWLGKPTDELKKYEFDLLQMVFRGQVVTTSDELTSWAKKHQTEARSLLTKVKNGVTAAYKARKYEAGRNSRMIMVLAALCGVVGVGSFLLRMYTKNNIAWVGVGVAVAMFVVGQGLLANRTQAGVEAAAKAEGLKKFLKDFSHLQDAPVGHLILWERFLVFAVTLGVSHELMQGLAARLPALLADPNFGVWYVGPHGHWDGFEQIRTTTAASYVSASTPNSSGSGGGFSGGGGGGGGGGGFGAR